MSKSRLEQKAISPSQAPESLAESTRRRTRFRFRPAALIMVLTLCFTTMLGMKAVDITIWSFFADRYQLTMWTPVEESRGVGSSAHLSIVTGTLADGSSLAFETTLVDGVPRLPKQLSVAVVMGQPMPVWYWPGAPRQEYSNGLEGFRSDAALVAERPVLPSRWAALAWIGLTLATFAFGVWLILRIGRRYNAEGGDKSLDWRTF